MIGTELSRTGSTFYFRVAFDAHNNGTERSAAESMAKEKCAHLWADENIDFPPIPWDRYEQWHGVSA